MGMLNEIMALQNMSFMPNTTRFPTFIPLGKDYKNLDYFTILNAPIKE
jgi:hypothetical protein